MTFTLKKGQTLSDIFPPNKWKALFSSSHLTGTGKQLNAEKYVGILKFHGMSTQLQKQLPDDRD